MRSAIRYIAITGYLLVHLFDIAYCQIGGLDSYDFLNLAQSATTTSLGGYTIAGADEDISNAFQNPALINESTIHLLSLNHNFHLADISHGFIAYGLPFSPSSTSMMLGINYVNYGSFNRADRFGNQTGQFKGSETAITVGASKLLDDRLRLGINLKYASSHFDTYRSSGVGGDIGFHYTNDEKNYNWALVFRNIGGQISSYSEENETFPFEILLGYSKRLQHVPFKFYVTAHHLNRWNLKTLTEENRDPVFFGQNPDSNSSFSKEVDNFFRHLAFGGEFLIGKNELFRIRLGYNHLRNKELTVSGYRSLSGFSFGVGFKLRKVTFDYGVGRYHLAGGVNHISLSIDLDSIFDKL